jgi:hypothetical protein
VYEPEIQPLNPTSGMVELYDPDVTQMGTRTSFFYLRTTVPSFEDGITLNQWNDFCIGHIEAVDVFGDGLCGWFSLAICAGKLKHNKRSKGATGWTVYAWDKFKPWLDTVVREVEFACEISEDENAHQLDLLSAEHVLVGFEPGEGKTRLEVAKEMAALLKGVELEKRPRPEDAWFSSWWGNVAAKVLGRMIVVVTKSSKEESGDVKLLFTLYTPDYLESYSYTDLSQGAFELKVAGRTYDNLNQLKEAIEVVRSSFKLAPPPIFLFFNARDTHYKYYRELPFFSSSEDEEETQEKQTTQKKNKLREALFGSKTPSPEHSDQASDQAGPSKRDIASARFKMVAEKTRQGELRFSNCVQLMLLTVYI